MTITAVPDMTIGNFEPLPSRSTDRSSVGDTQPTTSSAAARKMKSRRGRPKSNAYRGRSDNISPLKSAALNKNKMKTLISKPPKTRRTFVHLVKSFCSMITRMVTKHLREKNMEPFFLRLPYHSYKKRSIPDSWVQIDMVYGREYRFKETIKDANGNWVERFTRYDDFARDIAGKSDLVADSSCLTVPHKKTCVELNENSSFHERGVIMQPFEESFEKRDLGSEERREDHFASLNIYHSSNNNNNAPNVRVDDITGQDGENVSEEQGGSESHDVTNVVDELLVDAESDDVTDVVDESLVDAESHDVTDEVDESLMGSESHDVTNVDDQLVGSQSHDVTNIADHLLGAERHDVTNVADQQVGSESYDVTNEADQLVDSESHDVTDDADQQVGSDSHDVTNMEDQPECSQSHDDTKVVNQLVGSESHDVTNVADQPECSQSHDVMNVIVGAETHDITNVNDEVQDNTQSGSNDVLNVNNENDDNVSEVDDSDDSESDNSDDLDWDEMRYSLAKNYRVTSSRRCTYKRATRSCGR